MTFLAALEVVGELAWACDVLFMVRRGWRVSRSFGCCLMGDVFGGTGCSQCRLSLG